MDIEFENIQKLKIEIQSILVEQTKERKKNKVIKDH